MSARQQTRTNVKGLAMTRSGIAKTANVILLAVLLIVIAVSSYMLYAYDYVGNSGNIVSVITFFIQCLFNAMFVLVVRIIHYKINS